MSRVTVTRSSGIRDQVIAVGIDVGGVRKGFHAVAITSGAYSGHLVTTDVQELSQWCRTTVQAQVIAIDAPSRWSTDGRARPAERELMRKGIWCFSTPTRQGAMDHPRNHFGWMLQGAALYEALEPTHPLCSGLTEQGQKWCCETFPHAITWQLTNGGAQASRKREQRRSLLAQAGIDLRELTNIDLVDAALCALTAYYAGTRGECVSFGEQNTGLIIVPARSNL